ncbi:hypothetical protein PROP_03137 [Propionicimonas sp. T2.31MG-18]|uniref:AAA family ATPase n=1 Tax=Propionicimonas sp. T2.31MG-18 TaxID=3157620 RepID=UPI0035E94B26
MSEQLEDSRLGAMVSAKWLLAQRFPPVEYVVPGLIPEGLTLLAAPPKIGKSWMVLGLGVACAAGGMAFGHIKVDERPVLYLALEDGHRRLQSRLRSIGVTSSPGTLHFLTVVQPGAMLPTLSEFMDLYAERHPLVVLDTLGRAMPPASPNETTYQRDYRTTSALKSVADACPGSSLIVVHHTRKAESADFLDAVSGTQGIAGAADTVMVLRRERQDHSAIVSVTSRDAQEGSYSLTLDSSGLWLLDGCDLEEAANAARTNATTQGVGDRMAELVVEVNRHPEGIRSAELAAALHMDDATVRRYLRRATDASRILNPSRGLYTPVTSVTLSQLPEPECDNETDVTRPLGGWVA